MALNMNRNVVTASKPTTTSAASTASTASSAARSSSDSSWTMGRVGGPFVESLDYDYLFKFMIVGDAGVGKSSLLLQFTDATFSPNYLSTIGVDFRIRTIEVRPNGSGDAAKKRANICKLQLWDTAGQERFRTITSAFYRNAHAIALVYDVTDMSSFEHIKGWLDDVRRFGRDDVQLILIGNKSDADAVRRRVPTATGEALAQQLGVPFIETSAMRAQRVDEAFVSLTRALIDAMPPPPPPPSSSSVQQNITVHSKSLLVADDPPSNSVCCRS